MTAPSLAGRRIALLPRYERSGPSSRLRLFQFVPWLEAAGAEVTAYPFFDDGYLAGYFEDGRKSRRSAMSGYLRRLRALPDVARADAVWVEGELFPLLPGIAERALALTGVPYVADYDDAIFHRYDLSGSALARRLLRGKLDPLLRGSALVAAGNPYLADWARGHGARRVEIVPTVVDPSRYPVEPPRAGPELRIGWIGTPANARYLTPVIAAANALGAERPVRMVTIGADALPGLVVPQERHRWSEATEADLLSDIDVGVMPLPDNPFERGKCAYKLIQYMAVGRPVIASPVGVNVDVVTPQVGMLASGADEWLAALRRLGADADLRRSMGAASRALVERHYSTAVVGPKLVAWFAQLCEARGSGRAA